MGPGACHRAGNSRTRWFAGTTEIARQNFKQPRQPPDTPSQPRGAKRPGCARKSSAQKTEGAGMPGAWCTRSLVCAWGGEYAHEYSQRVHRRHPAFPAQWFYGLYRALPGDRAFLPPSHADQSAHLTPASGRQDHTFLPSAWVPFVSDTACVHRIPPRVRDDREPPLRWDETARDIPVFRGRREAEYFSDRDWTEIRRMN
jgi:hypothetical protein